MKQCRERGAYAGGKEKETHSVEYFGGRVVDGEVKIQLKDNLVGSGLAQAVM